ncbi:2-hydroxyacylsphingosine 1-beta-galactosyltransferase-like [Bufo gargarizans]|uniref:2-hydroxyacylsphingosine 1-beta-galactosyltransferase-like n=1 Tax=Bufo gargarizans TaxID=30331 RepID=UPI001CF387A7|nr:2-hydroxyacylsphingosine 1-beta-galactosyltransferase-like [Bufo gargarizans]
MKSTASVTLLLWFTFAIGKAAKIIIVPSVMFESHLYIFKTVATALHDKGHESVFLISEGRDIPPSSHYQVQRYPGIFNSTTSDQFLQSKMKNIFSRRFTALEMLDILDHFSRNCDIMVGNQELMNRLKKENYDMVIVDPIEICGFVIANILDIKYVAFSTGLWFPVEVGAPAPLSYVPEFNSLLTDRMGLLERIYNTIVYLVSRFGINFIILPKYDRIMRKHNILPARSMYELVEGSSLWMLCTDVALEFPRPTLPHVVYVGGILTKPANQLPQDFQAWVDNVDEHGFVLVSFGTAVKHLSKDIAEKLAGALAKLHQKVIWRFTGPKPRNLGNNTKLVEWLPQNDLLGHLKIKTFLSHGGLNGIFEAMYHGVPVVGIPLFGDHYDTMTRVQAKGMGIHLDRSRMTTESLYESLSDVIHNPSYRQQSQKLSRIHKDQTGHPVTRAAFWIDYVLRHNGAEHLRAATYCVSIVQYFLVDIVFLTVIVVISVWYVISKIRKYLWKRKVTDHSTTNGFYHNGLSNGKHKKNNHIKNKEKVK